MKPTYAQKLLPEISPRYKGLAGEVWEFDLERMRERTVGKEDACLGSWFIHCPGANILWYAYALHLIHLRPLTSVLTKFYLEGATHEISLYALDPDWKVDLTDFPHHLHPVNFAAQFKAGSDEEALRYVRRSLVEVVEGDLNPDTDARRQWIERFGDNMLKR